MPKVSEGGKEKGNIHKSTRPTIYLRTRDIDYVKVDFQRIDGSQTSTPAYPVASSTKYPTTTEIVDAREERKRLIALVYADAISRDRQSGDFWWVCAICMWRYLLEAQKTGIPYQFSSISDRNEHVQKTHVTNL